MIIIRSIFISIIINYYHYYCELWKNVLNIHYIFIIIITYYYYHYYVYVYIYINMYDYICWIFSDQVRSPATKLAWSPQRNNHHFFHTK